MIFKNFLLVAVLALGACGAGPTPGIPEPLVVGNALAAYTGLRDAIERYYTAEKNRDWKSTYDLRPAAFSRIVPLNVYERDMEKGSSGWNLLRVEIMNAKQGTADREVIVVIRFQESFDAAVAQSTFSGRVSPGTNSRVEETIWRRSGMSWSAVQPGQRGHFPLNDRLVN